MAISHSVATVLVVIAGCFAEPHCSKFPYEEALLEKMIRMEIKVEQMEQKILAAKDKVLDEAEMLKEKRKEIREISESLKQDIGSRANEMKENFAVLRGSLRQELTDMTSRIEAVFQQKEAQISRMSGDLMTLKNGTLLTIKSQAKSTSAYFMAKLTSKLSYKNGETFVFNSVLHKTGDHYNPSTGKFTAPVDGVYLFTVQLCATSSHAVEFEFKVEGKTELVSLKYSAQASCESFSFMKDLKSGNRVWVSNTHSNTLKNDQWRWNVFSGTLISVF